MILVKANPDLEARLAAIDVSDMSQEMDATKAFNEALRRAGAMKDCGGLRPTRDAKRRRFDGASRTVIDRPFTGDLVAGYWIWA